VRNESVFVAEVRGADSAVNVLRRFCAWIAARMVSDPGLYSLLSVVVVGALALIYANLEPRYRLADQVPDREQAVDASHRLDAKLNGANPIDVLIECPKGKPLYDPETLASIAAVTQRSISSPASPMCGRSRHCGAGLPRRPASRTWRR
jgi:uncharacterized protein